ncbi:MAG: UDP-N-acetylmuramate--L-alanine ligase [Bacilli bacterium]|nr:UDP-N-acetylmuramate--L-alanine ligase [Bacilli bacterium]
MKYYCLGIKGAGMSTLACILHDLGNEVVGYDDVVDYKFTQEGLEKRGIKIYNDNSHALDKDMIVTHSVALSKDHKELVRAQEQGLKVEKYNEILGSITSMFNSICVSGTHGKTTTSSLITHILNGIKPVNYFIGDGTGHAVKDNDTFVIESDEFNRHFLAYDPTYTVITNIELEHTEIYKDIEDIMRTFETFASKTKNTIVACGDNEYVRKLNFDNKIIYYGLDESNNVYAKNIVLNEEGSNFDVYMNNEFYGHFELPLYGMHMVLNSLAAIIICHLQGVDAKTIETRLKTFQNAKRRFAEQKINETILIDDYAHHPTEIKVTLEAARQKYPNKQLIAIFKPNTYSRTEKFYKEFAEVLNIADKCFLTEIDCNRERKEDYSFVTSKVIFDLLNNGEMISEEDVEKIANYKDSVICLMSCASVAHLKENLINVLEK